MWMGFPVKLDGITNLTEKKKVLNSLFISLVLLYRQGTVSPAVGPIIIQTNMNTYSKYTVTYKCIHKYRMKKFATYVAHIAC